MIYNEGFDIEFDNYKLFSFFFYDKSYLIY